MMKRIPKVSRGSVEAAFDKARSYLYSLEPEDIFKVGRFNDRKCNSLVKEVDIILPGVILLNIYSEFVEKYRKEELALIDSLQKIVKKRSKNGTVNYFLENNYKNKLLPDDLDDTVFSMRAMNSWGIELPVKFFTKLIELEEHEGGPYKTWFTSQDNEEWMDIDPYVNANLYAFSSEFGISLRGLERYLVELLRSKEVISPYYPGRYFFAYLLAKGDSSRKKSLLKNEVIEYIKCLELHKEDMLERTFKALTSIYTDTSNKIQADLEEILENQHKDGSFSEYAFCHGYAIKGKKSYIGSRVISTAFVLELLNEVLEKTTVSIKQDREDMNYISLTKRFNNEYPDFYLNKDFQTKIVASVYLVVKDFKTVLSAAEQENVDLMIFSLNLGWGAYTILDDFLDLELVNEKKSIIDAFYYLNECWKHLFVLFKDQKESYEKIKEAYNKGLEFYYKDIEQPQQDYKYIQQRMLPYIVSIKELVTYIADRDISNRTMELIEELFVLKHSIDQFSDDASDLKKDFISYLESNGKAGSVIISRAVEENIRLKKYEDLSKYFWEEMCNRMCKSFLERAEELKEKIDKNQNRLIYSRSVLDISVTVLEDALADNKKYKDLILNI